MKQRIKGQQLFVQTTQQFHYQQSGSITDSTHAPIPEHALLREETPISGSSSIQRRTSTRSDRRLVTTSLLLDRRHGQPTAAEIGRPAGRPAVEPIQPNLPASPLEASYHPDSGAGPIGQSPHTKPPRNTDQQPTQDETSSERLGKTNTRPRISLTHIWPFKSALLPAAESPWFDRSIRPPQLAVATLLAPSAIGSECLLRAMRGQSYCTVQSPTAAAPAAVAPHL